MPTGSPSGLERAITHDRALVAAGLGAITLLSWIYLLQMSAAMQAAADDASLHAAMGMPEMAAWGMAELVMLFLMWAVMMVAMMLPSAAPIILLVINVYRRRNGPRALTIGFVSGYLIAWTIFSAAAAATQLLLHRAALLTPAMATRSAVAGGAILLLAGVYQWLPLKRACLTHCRSPLAFLSREWREGAGGALTMGLRHGLYCVGCCWAIMLLLFTAGVMNLFWVAAIAAFVLVEKLVPQGARLGRIAGVLLMAWGVWVMTRGA